MKTKILSASFLAALMFALPASAHPRLTAAGPIPGSVIKTAPKNLRIQFSEAVEPAFSGVTLKNSGGETVALAPATLSQDKKLMSAVITRELTPGKYTVEWHALGADTHPQKGRFSFELKP